MRSERFCMSADKIRSRFSQTIWDLTNLGYKCQLRILQSENVWVDPKSPHTHGRMIPNDIE
jgi:hypothetical protein